MADDRKDFPKRGGPPRGGPKGPGRKPDGAPRGGKPAGPRPDWKDRPKAAAGAGKPAFKGKPRPTGDKPWMKKDGEQGDARPARTFKPRPESGGDRPARREQDGAERPFRKPFAKERGAPRSDDRASFGRDGDRPRFKPAEGRAPAGPRGDKPAPRSAPRPFGMREKSEAEPGERIAKRLARVGIASRRDAEELIAAGRVTINGKVLSSPALNVLIDDVIAVDGTIIPPIERTRLFLFHKPAGIVTTNRDPEGRKTVFDILPQDLPRLMTVGRLDINTEGLLLLTNDGGLSRVLELPATGWLRRYRVRVHGKVEESALAGLKDGIAVDGVFYGAIEASLDREQGSNAWLSIGLREGKNREVKNILGALGLEVSRLIRVSYGPFQLNDLPEGHVQEIRGRMLRDQLGERLIEESGANFEAPVVNPFSNAPVKRSAEPREEPAPVKRDGERGRIGEGGLIKRRQRREGSRDEALGKLSTRPERPKFDKGERPARPDGPSGFAKGGRPGKNQREQRPIEPPGQRKANVWMAPGARPQGAGRVAAEKAETDAKRAKGGKPFAPRGGNPGAGRPGTGRPRSDRPGPPRKDGDADRRR